MEGLGLFARDAIKADTFLCEYVGELIRRPLEDAREQQWQAQGRANYLFRRDKEWVIDATKRVRAAAGDLDACVWCGGGQRAEQTAGPEAEWWVAAEHGAGVPLLCCSMLCCSQDGTVSCQQRVCASIGSSYPAGSTGFWVALVTACDVLQGNHARYINHSCDGNCQSFTVTSKNDTRIIICAKRDIQPGEELCYDYKVPPSLGQPSWSSHGPNCCMLTTCCYHAQTWLFCAL